MKSIENYLQSGIIESYVFGLATDEEINELEEWSGKYEEVRLAIEEMNNNLEQYAMANAVAPPSDIKPMIMASVDFLNRIENGEVPSFPPLLHAGSLVSDYAEWLEKSGMQLPEDFTDLYAKIIDYTPQIMTAIVWIKSFAPPEIHHDEHERFLIVEGACNMMVEEDIFELSAGDYFSIPLYKSHKITVTSEGPCKVILQRVAA